MHVAFVLKSTGVLVEYSYCTTLYGIVPTNFAPSLLYVAFVPTTDSEKFISYQSCESSTKVEEIDGVIKNRGTYSKRW
jgi:hypothetical protein